MTPTFTTLDVLNALRAGKARDFTEQDQMCFNGAPDGSCILECFGSDWLVIVGAGFQVECHAVDDEGDPVAYMAHADGKWMAI